MTRRTKKILWIAAGVAALVPVVLVIVLVARLNAVVKMGVQIGGTAILGVNTTVEDVDVSLLKRRVKLNALRVAEPPGFASPIFAQAQTVRVQANVGSLMKREIYLPEVSLDAPEFTAEYANGKWNFNAIMDQISGGSHTAEPKDRARQFKFKIDRLVLTNVHVRVLAYGQNLDVRIPNLTMAVADKDGNAVPADEVLHALLGRVFAPVQDATSPLVRQGKELTGKAGESLKGVGSGVDKASESVKKVFK